MGFGGLLLLAVGLSMDAFTVSVCKGLCMKKATLKSQAICGAWFGGFQGVMPVIGFVLTSLFASLITSISHWIAFVLLGIIGFNMIHESLSKSCEKSSADFSAKAMFPLAVATSIDALAVGVSFAFLSVDLWKSVTVIGITTFLFSFAGVRIGNIFGSRYSKAAEITGGVILILLGCKILVEHLFFS
mgnify:CR=1 FL=1